MRTTLHIHKKEEEIEIKFRQGSSGCLHLIIRETGEEMTELDAIFYNIDSTKVLSCFKQAIVRQLRLSNLLKKGGESNEQESVSRHGEHVKL